jgi:hypothetical protein
VAEFSSDHSPKLKELKDENLKNCFEHKHEFTKQYVEHEGFIVQITSEI